MMGLKIVAHGSALGDIKKEFKDGVRYRHKGDFIDVIEEAVINSEYNLLDIDLIIGAFATPLQLLPCSASIVANRLGISTPVMDINTSCSSFITALDISAHFLNLGTYKSIMIITGDNVTVGLNKQDKKTHELFSSAATAFVVQSSNNQGVLYHKMMTYPEYAHDTEIAGGGSVYHASKYAESPDLYYFRMDGESVLRHTAKTLPQFVSGCFADLLEQGINKNDFAVVIPHQASKALPMIMRKLKINNYIDRVKEYGNMVSSGVPYVLCAMLNEGKIVTGDKVLLLCTAAGLTYNFMALQL